MKGPVSFRARSAASLALAGQRTALVHLTAGMEVRRRQIVTSLPAWPDMTARATAIRRHTLSNLAEYLEQLESAILARGGHVVWARNSNEANAAIVGLARQYGVSQIVQTRSAVAQEIGLGLALRAAGIAVQVTDMGEFMADLAGERPAHPNNAVAHLRIDDLARVAHEKLDIPMYLNAPALARVVRARVRQAARGSRMCVIGVDMAVAETGTLAAFNDQGDVRLAATLAPLRVALMGLQDVVPTPEDLFHVQAVHTASAGRDLAPSCIELFSAADASAQTEGSFYLILVDNGRTDVLAGDAAEVLNCIRCGACASVCPVARRVGSRPYAWTYPGPVGAVMAPLLLEARFGDVADASTLCGACRTVCPVGVDIPRLLLQARTQRAAAAPFSSRSVVRAWPWNTTQPARVSSFRKVLAAARRLGNARGTRRWLLPWYLRWTATRDLPQPARESFHSRWARRARGTGDDR